MRTKWILFALMSVFVLSGCMTTRIPDLSETRLVPGVSDVAQPRKETVYVGQASEPYRAAVTPDRHTLSFIDMDIRQALAVLSGLSDAPIVAESGVSGAVNLSVEDKTVAEILMAMTKQFGYSAYVEDGVIVVGQPRMITRAFYLNYLRDKRASKSVTNASISSTSGSDGGGSSGEQGNVTVTTSSDTDFWKDVKEGLQQIVFGGVSSAGQAVSANSSGKKIVINDMTGVVYVTDNEENMEIVSSFLRDIDGELKRQVMIQAHIVEVDLDNEFSLGVNWDGVLSSGSGAFSTAQNLTAGAEVSGLFNIKLTGTDFSLMLDALKTQGHVNMLSSPKISTMNNQKAVIKLTTKEVTWIQETTNFSSSSDAITTSVTPQIDEVGLFLDVTPNIDADGSVTMHVHPSISEIIRDEKITVDGNEFSKPVISVREIDTMAEVKSGETVVIAGLIVDKTREVKRSVPLLGDIPFLGLAFSNFEQQLKKTELAIFLTPYVLESQSMSKIRLQQEERLRRLEELSSFIETRPKAPTGTTAEPRESSSVPVKTGQPVVIDAQPEPVEARASQSNEVVDEPMTPVPDEEVEAESGVEAEAEERVAERVEEQDSPVARSGSKPVFGYWATAPPRRR